MCECKLEIRVPKSHVENVVYEVSKYLDMLGCSFDYITNGRNIYFSIKYSEKQRSSLNYLIKQLNDYINQTNEISNSVVDDVKYLYFWGVAGLILLSFVLLKHFGIV
jgi:hypothetical protein